MLVQKNLDLKLVVEIANLYHTFYIEVVCYWRTNRESVAISWLHMVPSPNRWINGCQLYTGKDEAVVPSLLGHCSVTQTLPGGLITRTTKCQYCSVNVVAVGSWQWCCRRTEPRQLVCLVQHRRRRACQHESNQGWFCVFFFTFCMMCFE